MSPSVGLCSLHLHFVQSVEICFILEGRALQTFHYCYTAGFNAFQWPAAPGFQHCLQTCSLMILMKLAGCNDNIIIMITIISKVQILEKPSALYNEHDGSGGAG